MDVIQLKDGSVMKAFYYKAKDLSPEERGRLLEADTSFIAVHEALAAEGQTEAPPAQSNVNHHFISLVNVGNELFEFDGSKSFPIPHGATSDESFLSDAARVCKEFIARDPTNVSFTILALANNK